jgi:hypothetical protein
MIWALCEKVSNEDIKIKQKYWWIIEKYNNIENIEIINGTLDDVFLNLTETING